VARRSVDGRALDLVSNDYGQKPKTIAQIIAAVADETPLAAPCRYL
jgi:hypothetical protein